MRSVSVVVLTVVCLAHDLSALVDLPANVRIMVEMRRAGPWQRVGKFLDFLGERESTGNESLTRRVKKIDDRIGV
jgi:hypothetical protein